MGTLGMGDPVNGQDVDIISRHQMQKLYKFILHRGILAMWLVHPVYKALLIVRDYPRERDASLTLWRIPVLSVHVHVDRDVAAAGERWSVILNPPAWIESLLRLIRKPDILSVQLSEIWLVVSRRDGWRNQTTRWQRRKVYLMLGGLLAYVAILALTSVLIINLGLSLVRAGATTAKAVARSIPALLAVLFVGFATGDAWRIFGQEPYWRFGVLVAVLVGAGLAAMLVNLRTADGWQSVFLTCQVAGENVVGVAALEEWGKRTPVKKLLERPDPVLPLGSSPDDLPPALTRASAMLAKNVWLLFWLTMALSVLWTAVFVSLIFVVIGVLAISLPTTNDLLGSQPGHPLAVTVYQFGLLGQQVTITRQLLLLSAVLGSVAALTFATSTLQDPGSRPAFEDHALKSLRRAFAALGYYLAAVAALLRQLEAMDTLEKIDGIDARAIKKLLQSRPPASGRVPPAASRDDASPT
jgi:hypothetical protein